MMKTRITLTLDQLKTIDRALEDLLYIHSTRVMELADSHNESLMRHNDPESEFIYEANASVNKINNLIEEEQTVEQIADIQKTICRGIRTIYSRYLQKERSVD